MEYYSVIKKNKIMLKIMPFAATWMELDIITLSEVSQTKTKVLIIHSAEIYFVPTVGWAL